MKRFPVQDFTWGRRRSIIKNTTFSFFTGCIFLLKSPLSSYSLPVSSCQRNYLVGMATYSHPEFLSLSLLSAPKDCEHHQSLFTLSRHYHPYPPPSHRLLIKLRLASIVPPRHLVLWQRPSAGLSCGSGTHAQRKKQLLNVQGKQSGLSYPPMSCIFHMKKKNYFSGEKDFALSK